MARNEQHMQGYRHAAKDAIQFLEERAKSCNDPKAQTVLFSAAFSLGVMFAYQSKPKWERYRDGYPGLVKMARLP